MEIPPDKQKLYKIIIEKNYKEHPGVGREEPIKKKTTLKMIGLRNGRERNEEGKEGKKEDKEGKERKKKIMIHAAKKFRVENHANEIFKEDKDYLKELNSYIED